MTTAVGVDVGSRQRELIEELGRAGVSEVDASSRRRAEYSSDASLYRVMPQAIAFPRDADEVAAILDVCRKLEVPITARGAGTSTAGNAVGTGLVVDTRRHLNRIVEIDAAARAARVQPGVVLDDLQDAARPHGLRFGPEPSTHDRCTAGGLVGNNACGSRALGFGRTSDNLESLSVIDGTGRRLTAGVSAGDEVEVALARIVGDHRDAIEAELGTFSRQISGYPLQYLLPGDDRHVGRSLVGTEGTCGLVTEATLGLVEIPAATVLVLLGFADMASAADAAPALATGFGATAVEGLDRRIVAAAESHGHHVPEFPRGEGWLLVELAGDRREEVVARVPGLAQAADPLGHRVVDDPTQVAAVWKIREAGVGLVSRDSTDPMYPGWEDAAVPAERLGTYLREFDALLDQMGLRGVPYGHFGDGCIHVRIDFPFTTSGTSVFREFLDSAARLVVSHGGSMSGEHGDGRARSELLPALYSEEIIAAFREYKSVFDPAGLLNPGVLVDPDPVDANIRPIRRRSVAGPKGFALTDDAGDLAAAVHRCVGVGKCTVGKMHDGEVMCPSYAATHDEHHVTRGRARVLQEAVTGGIDGGLTAPEVHDALDWCMACKGCLSDCPAGVDMATYKAEVLHRTYHRRRRPLVHYTLGWLPRWLRLASNAPALSNLPMRSKHFARIVKRLAGIDDQRSVPTIHRRPQIAPTEAPSGAASGTTSTPSAVLWVDSFTGHLRPNVVTAAARVLTDAGYSVRSPSASLCCGLTWLTTGQLEGARRRMRAAVDGLNEELGDQAGNDAIIVGLEPSCTAALRHEAIELLGPDDAAATRVAKATRTLAQALAERVDWTPPSLDGVELVAQPHCHHHAVLDWSADRKLLESAGATLTVVGGCCGLAGDFGTARGRYQISHEIAETALLPALRGAPVATALADGYSCHTQIADMDGRTALHLAELLATALDRGER